ncbi:Predicted transcriptional regulator YheO, contains PAS and DNA-binding HTH domains [Caminicella sporogenes DSM 14501]|uniref:Predicted transcriptional regulator YheO, contains PAS and DNA-binding HTH domains n=1 Tax=Caminicella sporogenes DSM 14501 TaxID=1121266 RepID=A0A1M6LUM6_9FIRM|nr:PAS domain-containing protein [Caminicella sporogenes]RKD27958.1 hypothetical protein BET04_02550 [Caminicella sporogenes]WIF94438.1 PAS domain-containing protein [Caminicella sporogenes]SHJ74881.1 Predicted transcriptional regulator YheO, contains PAS and DNA-binding HTH domains [Caminicella sporogenes DSM 14501]
MADSLNPILKSYIPIVEGIARTFGRNCEVVLHDFSKMNSSIIAIENGHVTGRSIGSPMTEEGLRAVRKKNIDNIINYTGKTADGRLLKSSTMFIKDENDEVIGCLCINFDISELFIARRVFDDIMQTDINESEKIAEEVIGNKVNDVLTDIVKNTLKQMGKPVAYMSKEEKVNIVKKLDQQGAFLIKGAIDYVAKVLCVSRYTIYNYLDEIRVDNK